MYNAGIIKYGISMNYVSSWGYKEAIREIVQNFKDYGDYNLDEGYNLEFRNCYQPTDTSFLKIGFSKKDNPNAVGKYGEGIKMALLVLHRNNIPVYITATIGDSRYQFRPTTYCDDMLGECFGIEYQSCDVDTSFDDRFCVTVKRTIEYDKMGDYFITNNTPIIFKHYDGDIVDMPAGNIYVGGIFVTKFDDLPRSYNIKASHVDLGRDRNFPCTFDIEYWTSRIVEAYMENNVDEIESFSAREVKHLHNLPNDYVKDVEPTMVNGQMKFKTKTGMLPDRFEDAVRNNRDVQIKITKLNDTLTKRKSPTELLTMFKSKHEHYMRSETLCDLDSIISKSANWH